VLVILKLFFQNHLMKNSVLLFGGASEERLVSVASAQNIASQYDFSEIWFIHNDGQLSVVSKDELLNHQNAFEVEFKAIQKSFAPNIKNALSQLSDKIVFLALHGTEGEDGVLQALLENSKIMFTGSGANSSKNAFIKDISKAIVSKFAIEVAPQLILSNEELWDCTRVITGFFQKHGKIVLKPLANGSSIGLHIVSDFDSLNAAIKSVSSANYGPYLAEKFIEGRELTVGVFEEGKVLRALPPSEVILKHGHSFDYQGKYLGLGTTEVTPAELSSDEVEKVQLLAKTAHQALGCFGYSRTDIMLTSSGLIFMETNTLPGLSKASFVPQQLKAAGIEFAAFIDSQMNLAKIRYSS
jgi:D-alanine-D-alanine ligase